MKCTHLDIVMHYTYMKSFPVIIFDACMPQMIAMDRSNSGKTVC